MCSFEKVKLTYLLASPSALPHNLKLTNLVLSVL